MTLHHDLLTQATHLATNEPKRPKQASLRRSVSASCYALYHLLVDSAVRRLISAGGRTALRDCLRRGFKHSTMKVAALQFANHGVSSKLEPGLNGLPLQPELVNVARTFVDLQELRHAADYDLSRPFSRLEALDFALDASVAFFDWNTVRKTPQADTFLVGLLSLDCLHG